MNISVFPFYLFSYLVQTVFQMVWNKKYLAMYCQNTIYYLYYCLKTNLFCIVQVSHQISCKSSILSGDYFSLQLHQQPFSWTFTSFTAKHTENHFQQALLDHDR